MYFEHYGLKEKPFSLAADPRYLYYSRSHQEALAQMIYAATEDSGFLILTGEIGTGKTILINTLIDRLPKEYRVAKIYHTALNPKGLVQNICKEFGLEYLHLPTSQLILKIQDFLKWTHNAGERSLLILDEAQDLNTETLEEVRLLSNFEADHKKILQIFLVGQPELEKNLAKEELRAFRERVSLKYRLKKLDHRETIRYMARRLAVAGQPSLKAIFTEEAVDEVHKIAGGIPRRINILCENALLMGYTQSRIIIDRDIIKQIADHRPVDESFTEYAERELQMPVFGKPRIANSTPSPAVKHPKASPPQSSRTPARPKTSTTTVAPNTNIARGNNNVTRASGNGAFDYKQFQKYMNLYLNSNDLHISKRSKPGRIIFGIISGLILMILAILVAIQLAVQFVIIK